MVFCVALPVVNIDIWQTGNQKFQLLLVEDRDQLCRDNVVEAYNNVSESSVVLCRICIP